MRKYYISGAFFCTVALILLNTSKVSSKLAYPDPGNCGDAFSTALNGGTAMYCSQSGCHPPGDGSTTDATATDVTITIGTGTPTTPLDASFKYDGGVTYNMAFLINDFATNNPYYGFQMIAEDAGGDTAGHFTVTNAAQTHLSNTPPFGAHKYMGHLNAGSTHNWSFKWTAPNTSTGPITFYYAFNVASFAGTPPPTDPIGDIYKGAITIQPNTAGIADINDKLSALSVYPTAISSEGNISFNLKNNENVSAKIFSLNGVMDKEVINEQMNPGFCNRTFDMSGLSAGVYLLKLQVGDAYVTKKIVKE